MDCHVHLYPHYDLGQLFKGALNRLQAITPAGSRPALALALTERASEQAFEDLCLATTNRIKRVCEDFEISIVTNDANSVVKLTEYQTDRQLWILPGCQIKTAEKLEVLALNTNSRFADGQPFMKTIDEVRESQALAVVPWSLGKWWGRRGALVRRGFVEAGTTPKYSLLSNLMAGDIAMRTFGSQGSLAANYADKDTITLAGSDPLPIAGEERFVGSYGTAFCTNSQFLSGSFDDFSNIFADPALQVQTCGARNPPMSAISRSLRLAFDKKG